MLADTPLREGYLEGMVGASTASGPYARVEGGYRLLAPLAAFAFAEWRPSESTVGAGVRVNF